MIINLPEINHKKISGEDSSLYSASFLVNISLEDLFFQLVERAVETRGTLLNRGLYSTKSELLFFLSKVACFNSEIKNICDEYYNNVYELLDTEHCIHCISKYGDLNIPVKRILIGKTLTINNINYIYFFRNLIRTKEPFMWWNDSYLSKKYSSVAIKFYAWMWYCIDDYISEYNPQSLILFSSKELVKSLEFLFKKAVTKHGYVLQTNKNSRGDFDLTNNFLRYMAPKEGEYIYELRLEK